MRFTTNDSCKFSRKVRCLPGAAAQPPYHCFCSDRSQLRTPVLKILWATLSMFTLRSTELSVLDYLGHDNTWSEKKTLLYLSTFQSLDYPSNGCFNHPCSLTWFFEFWLQLWKSSDHRRYWLPPPSPPPCFLAGRALIVLSTLFMWSCAPAKGGCSPSPKEWTMTRLVIDRNTSKFYEVKQMYVKVWGERGKTQTTWIPDQMPGK